MSLMQKAWVKIGKVDDIPLRGGRVIKTAAGCVALFRTADDQIFAIDDRCPHKGGPLSQGIVHGEAVTCPLHNMVFNLATGKAQGADSGAVKTFQVKVENGEILFDLSSLAARNAG